MELVLHLIKYSIYNWNICRDLKVIDLLLSFWKNWPSPKEFISKIYHVPLLDTSKVFTPIQIKLGLLKNLLKQWIEMAMDL